MFSTEDLKTAIGATVIARRNAAARLREAGNPRDPFRALPGMEQQFFEAAQSVRSYDLVLNLLEREVKREARKRAGAHGAERGGVPHHGGAHHPRDAGLRGGTAVDALPHPRRERHRVYGRGGLAGLGGHSEVSLRTTRKEGKR